MAIYQGADTMEAERSQGLWDVLQGQKRHEKKTLGQLGKRQLFSAGSNIIEQFLPPGWKQLADIGSKQLEQQLFKLPEYEEDGGFWGSSEVAALKEQDVALREGADETLLEGIIGGVGDYVGGGGGFSFPGGGDPDMPQAYGDFSPELMSQFMKNGGRVPKYENGGLLSKLKFGKKKKAPERDEALVALDAILSGGYERKEGKHEYPMGYTQSQDWDQENGINLVRMISKFSTPEGDRYYPGEGKSRSSSLGQTKAMMDAASRAYHSPADSITTDQLAKLKELGLFAGGGMVESSPTIAGYFSQQGKTLGGSNTQSLSQLLGRK